MRKSSLLLLLLIGCSGNLSTSECNGVVDHMIGIFTAPATGSPSKEQQKASDDWREKLKGDNATKQHLMGMCKQTMSSSHASCVAKASDEKSLAECFGG
jgi:hypothetical protein